MPEHAASQANGFALSHDLNSRLVACSSLKLLGRETRQHSNRQIQKLAQSLDEFGFVIPIVTDQKSRVVAGWGIVLAARRLGLTEVPAITIADLGDAKLRSLRLALNRLAEDSSWDGTALKLEFSEILALDAEIDLQMTGFEMGEIDVHLSSEDDEEDELSSNNIALPPIAISGDLWNLGNHRIVCGDALDLQTYVLLMAGDVAQMVFADPPWNVPIDGHVSGLGSVRHQEFAMASGEMSHAEFQEFLRTSLGYAAHHSVDGSIHYVAMDWRGIPDVLAATSDIFAEMKNLCVWNKTNAGMGSLYRSKHELVFVFKKGRAPHINNVELGRNGRSRSNVWDYPGQNSRNGSRKSKLALHPTAKPVALVADALRDCSHRNGIVLDPFGGSGTTLIAAEKTGRQARLIEYEPRFVDVTIRRWQQLTGRTAVHGITRLAFGQGCLGAGDANDAARCTAIAGEAI
jgi:DNA modification methylase